MENKINIAEILKDCPLGMELDCAMWNNVVLGAIEPGQYPIKIVVKDGDDFIANLTEFGEWSYNKNSKCIIFPKGKTTWEGFVPPHEFKDGDIVATNTDSQVFILQKAESDTKGYCYIGYDFKFNEFFDAGEWEFERLATEEEKQELFKVLKENGYRWNAENKTLEKLIEPKFKVGDKVKHVLGYTSGVVVKVSDKGYHIDYPKGEGVCYVNFTLEKDYELAPNKFDINTLKPFESKVLVRHDRDNKWCGSFFSHIDGDFHSHCYKFVTTAGKSYPMCIPYEGNEHLIGKTDDCNDFYKTWK